MFGFIYPPLFFFMPPVQYFYLRHRDLVSEFLYDYVLKL
jgi:hypothetical protein